MELDLCIVQGSAVNWTTSNREPGSIPAPKDRKRIRGLPNKKVVTLSGAKGLMIRKRSFACLNGRSVGWLVYLIFAVQVLRMTGDYFTAFRHDTKSLFGQSPNPRDEAS